MRFIAAAREELYIPFFRSPRCASPTRESAMCFGAFAADAFFSDGFLKINLPCSGDIREERRGEANSPRETELYETRRYAGYRWEYNEYCVISNQREYKRDALRSK